MNIITKETVGEYIVNGTWSVAGSLREEKGSDVVKSFTLNIKFENVPVESVIRKSLEPVKISFANSRRLMFDKFEGGTYTVDFKAPSTSYISLAEKLTQLGIDPAIAKLAEDNPALFKEIITKGTANNKSDKPDELDEQDFDEFDKPDPDEDELETKGKGKGKNKK